MSLTTSSNPAFASKAFKQAVHRSDSEVMTINGTLNKIFLLLLLVVAGASYTWGLFDSIDHAQSSSINTWALTSGIIGFILAMITSFKPQWAMYTAPLYAIFEGLFLGVISVLFNNIYPGIVMQAVGLTFACLFSLLFAYKAGIIKVNARFRSIIIAATGGIMVFYVLSFILSMMGVDMSFVSGSGLISIGISLVIVVVAALNLVLDFEFIERGAQDNAPKNLEWYAAFGLMVSLVWLYLELLRLLMKLASRD